MGLFSHIDVPVPDILLDVACLMIAQAEGRLSLCRLLRGHRALPHLAAGPIRGPASHFRRWAGFIAGLQTAASCRGRALLVPRFTKLDWPQLQQIGRSPPALEPHDLLRLAGLELSQHGRVGIVGPDRKRMVVTLSRRATGPEARVNLTGFPRSARPTATCRATSVFPR